MRNLEEKKREKKSLKIPNGRPTKKKRCFISWLIWPIERKVRNRKGKYQERNITHDCLLPRHSPFYFAIKKKWMIILKSQITRWKGWLSYHDKDNWSLGDLSISWRRAFCLISRQVEEGHLQEERSRGRRDNMSQRLLCNGLNFLVGLCVIAKLGETRRRIETGRDDIVRMKTIPYSSYYIFRKEIRAKVM